MRVFVVLVVAVLAVAVAITVLGFIGPYLAGLGLLLALVVLIDPRGIGTRIRQSPGWWGIPGMRGASRGAAGFAAMLLLYCVPIPMAAFAVVRVATSTSSPSAPLAVSGVGGATAPALTPAPPVAIVQPTATLPPTPTPTPTATPTPPPPTAVPIVTGTLPPITVRPLPTARDLCGAPANPWSYNFCGGATITSPPAGFCSYFSCIASFAGGKGYVVQCRDGMFALSGGRKGSCSKHGGERRPLNP